MTLGIGSLAMASNKAFCRPSARVAPCTLLSKNSASALPSCARFRPGHRRCVGAQRGQLFQQRRCGVARGVQPHRHRHQLLRDGLVGRLAGDMGDVHRQAARRSERRDAGLRRGQALGLELLIQHAGEGLAQLLQGFRRQLFDKQLDQKVLVHIFHWYAFALAGCGASAFGRPGGAHAAFLVICATHSRGAIGKPRRSRLS
jgi:hypothetical protein